MYEEESRTTRNRSRPSKHPRNCRVKVFFRFPSRHDRERRASQKRAPQKRAPSRRARLTPRRSLRRRTAQFNMVDAYSPNFSLDGLGLELGSVGRCVSQPPHDR
jgi:hypothetical protein